MKHYPKILVTGGSGMLGSHLKQDIPFALFPSSTELNLYNMESVDKYLQKYQPDIIIHAAAKVGGIEDNLSSPYDFFEQNVVINTNIISGAIRAKISRFLGISSTCAYPDTVLNYPIKECNLHDGPPSKSNFAYSYAKRNMSVQIDAANMQFGTSYNYIFPCNLYSEFDRVDNPKKMHFITSLLYKIALAELNNQHSIELFGTGEPMRQFMYAGDLSKIIKIIVDQNIQNNFNVAPDDSNLSIDYMTRKILLILQKNNWTINYNSNKPDGQYRKDVCIDLMKQSIGPFVFSSFNDTIPRIYNNYVQQILAKNQKTANTHIS